MLLYPIDYTMLEPEQFGALAAAAAAAGDRTAYLAAYGDAEAGWGGTYGHALVSLDDFLDYKPQRDTLILEHMLYSPQGTWGLATSDGEYAVVGGPHVVIDALRCNLPQREDEAVKAMARDSREVDRDTDPAWLRSLLAHIYGEYRAAKVWKKT